MFLIKKRSSKEVREHGPFLSLYCVFDQRAVPFLRDAFYRKANGRRKFNDAIVKEIVEQNLFQYPTEKSITRMAKACIKRLHALEDDSLVAAIASQPTDVAKQICLYALMKQSRLVWEFMLTVIGEKYRLRDTSFGKIDLNTFFMRLQEQNDTVASWSDTTITKLKQIIARVLVETEYLDNRGANHLNPVWLHPVLENAIRSNGDTAILPAFNCFS